MSATDDKATDFAPDVTAAAEQAHDPKPRTKGRTDATPLIDRYSWYELVAIYAGIALFLFFLLAPFIEGFLVSLKPLSQLFSSPYRFIPENASFAAYVTMWQSVPGFARYIFNSIFISTVAQPWPAPSRARIARPIAASIRPATMPPCAVP